jgi:hypothetical protein
MIFRPCLINEAKLLPSGSIKRYGFVFPPDFTDWAIELFMYREGRFSPDSLGREEHFKRAAKHFWHKKTENFVWHPWAEEMLSACCNNRFVGFAGCGSSGKSDFLNKSRLASPCGVVVKLTRAGRRYWQQQQPGHFQHGGGGQQVRPRLHALRLLPLTQNRTTATYE